MGHSFAKVWLTPKCDMDLVHPIDGSAYALSYSGQKYCDSLSGGEKPKIIAMGHHHNSSICSTGIFTLLKCQPHRHKLHS